MSEITVLPGTNRNGKREGFDQINIRPGDTLSIVGPTGSGKSAFINDIEVLAQADTVTGRCILVNGVPPSDEMARDPSKKPIALIHAEHACDCRSGRVTFSGATHRSAQANAHQRPH